nr:ABC transporter permease [Spirosomataceae bacterium]
EFSFNAAHPNADRIYKVVSMFKFDGKEGGNSGTPRPMAEGIRREVSGVELSVGMYEQYMNQLKVPQATGKPMVFEDVHVMATTSDFFQLVPYRWLAGSEKGALTQPNQVVLTQTQAEKYFPNLTPQQIVGKPLTYWDTTTVEVVGVVADLGPTTSFTSQQFVSLSTILQGAEAKKSFEEAWSSTNSSDEVYLRLNPKTNPQKLNQQINALSDKYSKEEMKKWGNFSRWHNLIALKDEHFATEYGGRNRHADRKILYALIGLGLFLLALAIINYVNLATAQVPQRAREIGVRKALGSPRGQLIGQFMGETAIVTMLACLLAYGWVLLFRTQFGTFLPEGIELYKNPGLTVAFMLLLIVVVSVLSGWYPSVLITRFQPTQVLRGQLTFSVGSRTFTLRKSLIVLQFAIAQAFIMGALIWHQQLRYALNADLGFDREAILTIQVPWKLLDNPAFKDKQFTLAQEMRRIPEISALSLGNPPLDQSFSSNNHKYKGKKGEIERNVYRKYVDSAYVGVYDMKLLAGRNLRPTDTISEYVVNEATVKAFGWSSPQEAIGKFLSEGGNNRLVPIVGVVKDFHTATFQQKIEPLALMSEKGNQHCFNIKLASRRPEDWQTAIQKIESVWKKTYSGAAFEYKFYDDMVEQFYERERTTASIINLATIVAILISCLGLFGVATYTAMQRTKEIGIRKVLGASVGSLVALLSKDFVVLVLISLVIAGPAAYYYMDQWLTDYAYRIQIEWWVFVATAAAAVLIAFLTVGYQAVRAALVNPVESLKSE